MPLKINLTTFSSTGIVITLFLSSTKHFWSFTAERSCSIMYQNVSVKRTWMGQKRNKKRRKRRNTSTSLSFCITHNINQCWTLTHTHTHTHTTSYMLGCESHKCRSRGQRSSDAVGEDEDHRRSVGRPTVWLSDLSSCVWVCVCMCVCVCVCVCVWYLSVHTHTRSCCSNLFFIDLVTYPKAFDIDLFPGRFGWDQGGWRRGGGEDGGGETPLHHWQYWTVIG